MLTLPVREVLPATPRTRIVRLEEFLDEHRPYASWGDLVDWQRRGHDVGLHTRTHPFCSRVDSDGIVDEIKRPASALAEAMGRPTVPFAYPFGNRLPDEAARAVLRDAPVSCLLGIDGPSELGAAAHRLGRACGEANVNISIVLRPLAKAVRASLTD